MWHKQELLPTLLFLILILTSTNIRMFPEILDLDGGSHPNLLHYPQPDRGAPLEKGEQEISPSRQICRDIASDCSSLLIAQQVKPNVSRRIVPQPLPHLVLQVSLKPEVCRAISCSCGHSSSSSNAITPSKGSCGTLVENHSFSR